MERRDFIRNMILGAGGVVLAESGLVSCLGRNKVESYFDEKTGMTYRRLGTTDLMVSEVSLGGEWLERHKEEEVAEVVKYCQEHGVNLLDVWMPNPTIRTSLGKALKGSREKWYIQGHIGSTWQNGQYVRTREMDKVKPAFEDLLERLQTDYIDLGMIHYVDELKEWNDIVNGEFYQYVLELKKQGKIRHIGMSTHNPAVAQAVAESGICEMILFSLNPAYDMLPADVEIWDGDFSKASGGINPDRAKLYQTCESLGVGITVMKAYAGARLFDPQLSPFGIALTPVQCLHYALTRPAVASVLVGCEDLEQVDDMLSYETASEAEKDYASVLANAPAHAYGGQCTYCGHCKPCQAGIDIAMVNKLSDLAAMHPEGVPDSVKDHYKVLALHASDCTECGKCETRCPFGVEVIEKMKKTRRMFGY